MEGLNSLLRGMEIRLMDAPLEMNDRSIQLAIQAYCRMRGWQAPSFVDTGVGNSQRDRMKLIRDAIATLQGSNGGTVPSELITQTLEAEGIKREDTEDALKRLKTAGVVIMEC